MILPDIRAALARWPDILPLIGPAGQRAGGYGRQFLVLKMIMAARAGGLLATMIS